MPSSPSAAGAKVYIARQIDPAGPELLRRAGVEVVINTEDRDPPAGELREIVRDCDGLVSMLTNKIDMDLLNAAPRLRGVANLAVGYDNFDLKALAARGIPASNTPGVLTDATADMAWALLFAAARRVTEADAFVRAGKWKGWSPSLFTGADITGATLGVVGAGRIGAAMARRATGFSMKVLYTARGRKPDLEKEIGAEWVELNALLDRSDFVSLHVKLTPATRNLIGEPELRRMKPAAILINTARGPVVDEPALVCALRERWIAGAGLDVFENEPALAEGLAALPNVALAPHIASATIATRRRMSLMACENMLAMLEGKRPLNLVE